MNTQSSGFSVEQLRKRLALYPQPCRYWVGFSGGADSTALLVAMLELRREMDLDFCAVHFDHGLQADAENWHTHCRLFCNKRNISIHTQKLEIVVSAGKSPEEQARVERYAAMETLLGENDIFLTAHHAGDNAETLFLNLMRGSGVEGLAAIPPLRKIGRGWVARPLLDFDRVDLEHFLNRRKIQWLVDPSNLNLAYDRNYVRQKLFPELDSRWPGVAKRINQSANHARTFATLTSQLLQKQHGTLIADPYTVAIEPFLQLEPELQAMLLRQWLRDLDIVSPPQRRLQEFLFQINASSRADKQPELRWMQRQIKRHGKYLWSHPVPSPAACPKVIWSAEPQLDLGPIFGEIRLSGSSVTLPEALAIGPIKEGTRISLHAAGPRRRLKELMRECGIPPWLRAAIPVLYWHGHVAAVGDWLISTDFHRFLARHSCTYTWTPQHPLLCKLQSVSVHFLNQAKSVNESENR